MPASMPLTTHIAQASPGSTDLRVIVAQYGNGIEQRAKDGINNSVESWTLSWNQLTAAEYNTVMTALEASLGTDYFTWTAPGNSTQKKYVINGPITRVNRAGDVFSITCPFKQTFMI